MTCIPSGRLDTVQALNCFNESNHLLLEFNHSSPAIIG